MAKAPQERLTGGEAVEDGPSSPPTAIDAEARDRLFRLAYRFLWNHADAEDAVQSAIATAWKKADQLRDRGKWWTWLCSIVVQRCRELRRRSAVWTRHADSVGRHAAGATSSSPEPDAAIKDRVRELLPLLAPRQYEVIVLRHLQAMDYDQIAEVLGITASTARVHAQAGRETLRQLLQEKYPRGEPTPQ